MSNAVRIPTYQQVFRCPVVQKLLLSYWIICPFSVFLRLNAMNELLITTQAPRAHVKKVECNLLQTKESVSHYRRLLRSCMRNKILRYANDKYFVSVKLNKLKKLECYRR